MNADAAFIMGYDHLVCQDYAYTTQVHHQVFAMVADGCSSSPHTDVGARLLMHSLVSHLHQDAFLDQALLYRVISETRVLCSQLSLPLQALDCTLLVAMCDQKRIRIMGVGDGVIALYNQVGQLISGIEIIYSNQMPGYLNYHVDEDRGQAYQVEDEGVHYRQLGPHHFGHESVTYHDNGLKILSLDLPIDDIRTVVLCSDGISSFPQLSTEEVLHHITQFPSHRGAFVQRRLNKFTRKTCKRSGWHHQDDVAMAAIHL